MSFVRHVEQLDIVRKFSSFLTLVHQQHQQQQRQQQRRNLTRVFVRSVCLTIQLLHNRCVYQFFLFNSFFFAFVPSTDSLYGR
jgi:hypothetical protein